MLASKRKIYESTVAAERGSNYVGALGHLGGGEVLSG